MSRSKSPANTPLPRLKIQLLTKQSKAKGKTKAKNKAADREESKLSFHGVVGELRYSSPKGRVEYCDLSSGWCQFSLGKGLQPHQITITSPRFVAKTFRVRSKKSQTVVVTLTPKATEKNAKAKSAKAKTKVGKGEVKGYGRSYAQLNTLPQPQLMARDGALSPIEIANLLRYGRTTPPSAKAKAKAKKSAKTKATDDQEPALTWHNLKPAAPGYVAISGDGSADIYSLAKAARSSEALPALGFIDANYKAPRVTAISLGRPLADAQTWAKIDASWQGSDYLSWLPQSRLKANLAQKGRSLLAWLTSDIGSNGYESAHAVDFVVVLSPIQNLAASRTKSRRFLALLRHKSGAVLAAKLYSARTDRSTTLSQAISDMVGHIPFEVAAIGSKDGDIALNMPKGLFTQLFPSPSAKAAAFQLRRVQGDGLSQALKLEPYASYPRVSYVSPLPLTPNSNEKLGRLRVGQRFVINQSFAALKTQPKQSPEQPKAEQLQFKDAKGQPMAFTLAWTKDNSFAVADINGVMVDIASDSKPALKAISGWFHPSTGAYTSAAQLQSSSSQGRQKSSRQILTVTVPSLVEVTTSPVPAKVTVAKQPMGIAPLAAYPPKAEGATPKLLPLEVVPFSPNVGSGSDSHAGGGAANAYLGISTKILPKTLRSSGDYALILKPDHLTRVDALVAAGKNTEAARYIATLPRSLRQSFPMAFVAASIKAKQKDYKGCHRDFQQLSRKAKSKQPLADHVASVLNESICLSHMMMSSSSLKRLKPTLASIKAVQARAKAHSTKKARKTKEQSSVELATLEFYGSHLKYLHWHATQDSRYLDQAVRGYRYYLSMVKDAPKRPTEGIPVNAAQYQLQAKKVIAMVDR